MPRLIRPLRRAALLAPVALLVLALPASAHPFVTGGDAPVDSLAEVTLAMAHGCGTEDAGGGDPTSEVAMEVPETVRIVGLPDVQGYAGETEEDEDGRIEVVTWTATDGGQPAPELRFDAVFSGEPGDEVYLKVFQGCDGFAYRWIGTPDEPADDPAIRVVLTEPDPDNPAPEPDTAPDAEPDPDEGTDTDAETDTVPDDPTDDPDEPAEPDPAGDPTDDGSDRDDAGAATADADADALDAAAEDPEEGGADVVVITTIALLLIVTIAAVIGTRSRRRAADGGAQDA